VRRFNPNALLWLILFAAPLAFAVSQTDLLTQVRGILAVANGGSGQGTYTPAIKICSGTIALNGITIGSGAKFGVGTSGSASVAGTTTCTGAVQATDYIVPNLYGDHSGITGFAPSVNGGVTIYIWLDSSGGKVDVYLINDTGASITTGASAEISFLVLR
jgi:hypothetical protein